MNSDALPDENRGTEVPRSWTPPTEKERLPHSRWGIASFVLGLLLPVVLLVIFCGLFIYVASFSTDPTARRIFPVLTNIGVFGYIFVSSAAFILGIVGICQVRSRKIFAVAGLLLSIPHVTICVLFTAVMVFVWWFNITA